MNPEIKAAWVKWLRDNPNKQGRGALHFRDDDTNLAEEDEQTKITDRDSFCCLGVLCHLAYLAGATQRWVTTPDRSIDPSGYFTYGDPSEDHLQSGAFLPPGVMAWAGLDSHNPVVTVLGSAASLGSRNDSGVYDFAAIANLIEEQL